MAGLTGSGLETHPDGTGNLNGIVNNNWNEIDNWLNPAVGLTASQSTTTVTSSSAIFTDDNVGDTIIFDSGESCEITAVGSTTPQTTCTVDVSQTVASTSWRLQPASTDQKTALVRGLVKATDETDVLSDGDAIKWDDTEKKFISAGYIPNGSLQSISVSGSTTAIDVSSGNRIVVTLTEDTELQFSGMVQGERYAMLVVQDGTGGWFGSLQSSSARVEAGIFEHELDASSTTVFLGIAISSSVIEWRRSSQKKTLGLTSGINSRTPSRGLYFDGATTSAALSAPISLGTYSDSFSLRWKFRVPVSSPSSNRGIGGLSDVATNCVGGTRFGGIVSTTGACIFRLYGGSSTDYEQISIADIVSGYGGKEIDFVIVRDAGNATAHIYINGREVQTVLSDNGSNPGWDAGVSANYALTGVREAANMFRGEYFGRAQMFNLALSADDVATIHRSGVPFDLQGASPTELIADSDDRDFATSGHNWVARGTGASVAHDAGNQELDVTVGNASTGAALTTGNFGDNPFSLGRRYATALTISNLSAGSVTVRDDLKNVHLSVDDAATTPLASLTDGSHYAVWIARNSGGAQGGLRVVGSDAASTFSIDDVSTVRVGCILDLDLEIGGGDIIPDRSGNGYDGTKTSGVSHIQERVAYTEESATSSSTEIDLCDRRANFVSIEADTTIGATNIVKGLHYTIILTDDGNGPFTVNFDSTDFEFEEGVENVSLDASGMTVFYGFAKDDSTVRLFRDPTKALDWIRSGLNSRPHPGGANIVFGSSSDRITSTLSGYSAGTDDFSMRVKFRVSVRSSLRGIIGVSNSATSAISSGALVMFMETSGRLEVRKYDPATSANFQDYGVDDFESLYDGKVVDVIFTRSGTTIRLYVNGVSVTLTDGGTNGTPPTFDSSITSTYFHLGIRNTESYGGDFYEAQLFNMALSASQVQQIHRSGVPFDLSEASPTAIIAPGTRNGGFETLDAADDFGTWVEQVVNSTTITDETTIVNSGSHACKITLDGSSSFGGVRNQDVIKLGKRYSLSFYTRKGAGASVGIQWGSQANGAIYGSSGLSLTTSYVEYNSEFVGVDDDELKIGRQSSSSASSEIYVDDVTLTRLGCILDIDLTAPGRFFPDRSGNGFHGTGTSGVSNLQNNVDKIRDVAYSSSIDIDFDDYRGQTVEIGSLTGNLTLTTSNIRRGDEVTLIFEDDGSSRTLTLPAWIAMGSALPTASTAGKKHIISLKAHGTTDATIIASHAIEA